MLRVTKGLFIKDFYSVIDIDNMFMTTTSFAFFLNMNPEELMTKLSKDFNGYYNPDVIDNIFFENEEDAQKALEYLEPLCTMKKLVRGDK